MQILDRSLYTDICVAYFLERVLVYEWPIVKLKLNGFVFLNKDCIQILIRG